MFSWGQSELERSAYNTKKAFELFLRIFAHAPILSRYLFMSSELNAGLQI